jgi:hypothetical protein
MSDSLSARNINSFVPFLLVVVRKLHQNPAGETKAGNPVHNILMIVLGIWLSLIFSIYV